jgi:hypothetical protein
MGKQTASSMDELYGRVMSGQVEFAAAPLFDAVGDCVSYFHENVAYNGVWLDPFVTLFYERKSGRLVGFKVKCVKAIVASIAQDRGGLPSQITFGDVVIHAGKMSQDVARAKDRQHAAESDLAKVVLPLESYQS